MSDRSPVHAQLGGPPRPATSRSILAALPATALVAILATFHLDSESLWLDEATSAFAAWMDWPDLWAYVNSQNPPLGLYFFLMHAWIGIGDSEAALRALSVASMVATVPVLYLLAQQLFGRRAAVLASVLFSINGFVIAYAQEARPYALTLFLITLCSFLFTRAIHESSATRWALYAATGTLAVYAQMFAALVLVGHVASLFFLKRRDVPLGSAILAYSAIGILTLPLMVSVYNLGTSGITYIDPPTLEDVMSVFSDLVGNGGWPLLLVYFGVCCLWLRPAILAWRSPSTGLERWKYAFVFAWFFVPVLLSLAVSTVRPIFLGRYLIVSLPAVVLVAAVGLATVRPRWIFVVLFTLVLIFAVRSLILWYGTDHKEQWRAAVAMVLQNTRDTDAIVFVAPYVVQPFGYYMLRSEGGADRAPEAISPSVLWNKGLLLSSIARQPPLQHFLRSEEPPPRIWLVLSHDEEFNRTVQERRSVLDALAAGYLRVSEHRFRGIHVFLFQLTP